MYFRRSREPAYAFPRSPETFTAISYVGHLPNSSGVINNSYITATGDIHLDGGSCHLQCQADSQTPPPAQSRCLMAIRSPPAEQSTSIPAERSIRDINPHPCSPRPDRHRHDRLQYRHRHRPRRLHRCVQQRRQLTPDQRCNRGAHASAWQLSRSRPLAS